MAAVLLVYLPHLAEEALTGMHHLVRFLVTHHASSALVTSLPMPFLGLWILTHAPSSSPRKT
jgi:hypothetical protein